MFNRTRRWLFHRRKPAISRGLSAYLSTAWRREVGFDNDLAEDPGMCQPMSSKPTQRLTRVIDAGDTLTIWEDDERTLTMETAAVSV